MAATAFERSFLVLLGLIRRIPVARLQRAVVTSTTPLRVRVEGEEDDAAVVAAEGHVLTLGHQRVLFSAATAADTGWLTIARPVGVEGDPRRRVKNGVLYLRGGVGRLDAWPALTTIVTLPVGSRPQGDVVADALTLNGVRVGTWMLSTSGLLRLAITTQPGTNTTVALTLPPVPVD